MKGHSYPKHMHTINTHPISLITSSVFIMWRRVPIHHTHIKKYKTLTTIHSSNNHTTSVQDMVNIYKQYSQDSRYKQYSQDSNLLSQGQ